MAYKIIAKLVALKTRSLLPGIQADYHRHLQKYLSEQLPVRLCKAPEQSGNQL